MKRILNIFTLAHQFDSIFDIFTIFFILTNRLTLRIHSADKIWDNKILEKLNWNPYRLIDINVNGNGII